ncbi:MAG: hypothetical protein ACRDOD_14640 [Streptosporangiaceae bacterium]
MPLLLPVGFVCPLVSAEWLAVVPFAPVLACAWSVAPVAAPAVPDVPVLACSAGVVPLGVDQAALPVVPWAVFAEPFELVVGAVLVLLGPVVWLAVF